MTDTLPPFRSLTFAVALVAFGADAQSGPIAWGYGAIAKGGAGGDVYYVTNLNDSGPGSLREGITNRNGPRVIVISVLHVAADNPRRGILGQASARVM
jgi:hypothetical protein